MAQMSEHAVSTYNRLPQAALSLVTHRTAVWPTSFSAQACSVLSDRLPACLATLSSSFPQQHRVASIDAPISLCVQGGPTADDMVQLHSSAQLLP